MKKKGFTLVELLVVIAIIAMLLAILMPALAKVRTLAQRIMCGTNQGGLGKAMMTYASDDKYESYPVGGGAGAVLDVATQTTNAADSTWHWDCKDSIGTGDNKVSGTIKATIGSCLYLLVKFADVPPEQFLCPGGNEKKFDLTNYIEHPYASGMATAVTDVWDFGNYADRQTSPAYSPGMGHNSYSYQQPLPLVIGDAKVGKPHPITASSSPSAVVLADRNPWFTDNSKDPTQWLTLNNNDTSYPIWDTTNKQISKDNGYLWNSLQHKQDGQNVLFADQHVKWQKLFNVGINQDNIYVPWNMTSVEMSNVTSADTRSQYVQYRTGPSCPNPWSQTAINFSQDDSDTYLVSDSTNQQ